MFPGLASPVVAVFVHASCDVDERRLLWHDLSVLDNSVPMMFVGDFNAILSADEKKGGRPFLLSESEDFQVFIEGMQLEDVGFSGPKFTWCNNRFGRARIWKRLDRMLLNHSCDSSH